MLESIVSFLGFGASILGVVVSAVVFALIDSRLRYTEKIKKALRLDVLGKKIKSRALAISLIVVMALLFGIFNAVVNRTVLHFSENEMLAEVASWVAFGALLPFLMGDALALMKPKESEKSEKEE